MTEPASRESKTPRTGRTKFQRCTNGCFLGCLTVLFVVILLVLFSAFLTKKTYEEVVQFTEGIQFVPGEQTVDEILAQESLHGLEIRVRVELDGATYVQWGWGEYTAWFLGDPVDTFVFNSHFGSNRINNWTYAEDGPYTDQEGLEEVISRIESYYPIRTKDDLDTGYFLHNFYSLLRLHEKKPGLTFPRRPRDRPRNRKGEMPSPTPRLPTVEELSPLSIPPPADLPSATQ